MTLAKQNQTLTLKEVLETFHSVFENRKDKM